MLLCLGYPGYPGPMGVPGPKGEKGECQGKHNGQHRTKLFSTVHINKKKYFRHADFFIYLKPISQQIYHIVSSTCTVCTKPRFCILEFVC